MVFFPGLNAHVSLHSYLTDFLLQNKWRWKGSYKNGEKRFRFHFSNKNLILSCVPQIRTGNRNAEEEEWWTETITFWKEDAETWQTRGMEIFIWREKVDKRLSIFFNLPYLSFSWRSLLEISIAKKPSPEQDQRISSFSSLLDPPPIPPSSHLESGSDFIPKRRRKTSEWDLLLTQPRPTRSPAEFKPNQKPHSKKWSV